MKELQIKPPNEAWYGLEVEVPSNVKVGHESFTRKTCQYKLGREWTLEVWEDQLVLHYISHGVAFRYLPLDLLTPGVDPDAVFGEIRGLLREDPLPLGRILIWSLLLPPSHQERVRYYLEQDLRRREEVELRWIKRLGPVKVLRELPHMEWVTSIRGLGLRHLFNLNDLARILPRLERVVFEAEASRPKYYLAPRNSHLIPMPSQRRRIEQVEPRWGGDTIASYEEKLSRLYDTSFRVLHVNDHHLVLGRVDTDREG